MANDGPAYTRAERRGRNTGWAIATAIGLSLVFYILYSALFWVVVATYASYDPTFATGFGALILLVIGPNVLGFLSGAVVAKVLFKQANVSGMFYGIATFMTVVGAILIALELSRADGSWLPVATLATTIVVSIIVVRMVLANDE